MSVLRPLIAGVLLLAVSSIALGPPNGTVGTLDFRYPNYIVEPLESCPYEGYFPHPRNNTWFYRCYKRYNSSFFWRAYFQCPPCTVFSGALDQCVFQETGTHCPSPPGTCRWALDDCRTCRADNSNRATSVCFKATRQCPGQLDEPLCRQGYVFDRSDGVCRSDPLQWSCVPDSYPTHILPPMTTPPPTTRSTTTPPAPPPTQPPPIPITPPEPTPPRPIFTPEQCGYNGEILGMEGDEVRKYCHPLCGDVEQTQGTLTVCDKFYQCRFSDNSGAYTISKQECDDPAKKFNPQTRRCVNPQINGCRPNKNLIR